MFMCRLFAEVYNCATQCNRNRISGILYAREMGTEHTRNELVRLLRVRFCNVSAEFAVSNQVDIRQINIPYTVSPVCKTAPGCRWPREKSRMIANR